MVDPISWSIEGPYYLAALLGGYLLGSIPFGLIFTRLAGLGDIRDVGSGNIGATNVLRTGKRGLAAATLLADAGKGSAAILIAATYGPDIMVMAGTGALLGHIFPVWLKFKGGKGFATYLGILFALNWLAGLATGATWLAAAGLSRYSSLATLIAALATPAILILFGDWQFAELMGALTLLVFIRHADNIRRLIAGQETKIGAKDE